jgi:hypothetical protein
VPREKQGDDGRGDRFPLVWRGKDRRELIGKRCRTVRTPGVSTFGSFEVTLEFEDGTRMRAQRGSARRVSG